MNNEYCILCMFLPFVVNKDEYMNVYVCMLVAARDIFDSFKDGPGTICVVEGRP